MDFSESVFKALEKIPGGKVATYKEIAIALGNPKAARAVGNACSKNPFAPRVPCHRIVCSDGRLGGYSKGENKKISSLKKEGIKIGKGKIINFKDVLISAKELK